MSYKLWVEKQAKKEIKKLPGNMRQRIRRAVSGWQKIHVRIIARKWTPPITLTLNYGECEIDPWRTIYVVDEVFRLDGAEHIRYRIILFWAVKKNGRQI